MDQGYQGQLEKTKGRDFRSTGQMGDCQEQRMLPRDEVVLKSNLAILFKQEAQNEEIGWRQRSKIQ